MMMMMMVVMMMMVMTVCNAYCTIKRGEASTRLIALLPPTAYLEESCGDA